MNLVNLFIMKKFTECVFIFTFSHKFKSIPKHPVYKNGIQLSF